MRIYKVEYRGVGVQKLNVPANSDFAFGVKPTDELPYSAVEKNGVELVPLDDPVNGYTVYPDKTGDAGAVSYVAKLIGLETRPVPTSARLFKSYINAFKTRYVTYGLPVTDDNFWASSNPPAGLATVYGGLYQTESHLYKLTEGAMAFKSSKDYGNIYRITFHVEGQTGTVYTDLVFLKKAALPADQAFISANDVSFEAFPAGYVQSWEDAPNCVVADHNLSFFQRDAYQGIGYIDVPTQVQVVKRKVPFLVQATEGSYMDVDFTE